MPRPEGAKNKPKNAKQLLEAVIAEYKKQGKSLTVDIKDIEGLTDEQRTTAAEALTQNPNINIPLEFELEGEVKTDEDTFTCGNCQAKLDGDLPECPYCGVPLTWE